MTAPLVPEGHISSGFNANEYLHSFISLFIFFDIIIISLKLDDFKNISRHLQNIVLLEHNIHSFCIITNNYTNNLYLNNI